MQGAGSDQRGLLETDHLYGDHVGRQSCCGFLASLRGRLFRDEEFRCMSGRQSESTPVHRILPAVEEKS